MVDIEQFAAWSRSLWICSTDLKHSICWTQTRLMREYAADEPDKTVFDVCRWALRCTCAPRASLTQMHDMFALGSVLSNSQGSDVLTNATCTCDPCQVAHQSQIGRCPCDMHINRNKCVLWLTRNTVLNAKPSIWIEAETAEVQCMPICDCSRLHAAHLQVCVWKFASCVDAFNRLSEISLCSLSTISSSNNTRKTVQKSSYVEAVPVRQSHQ